MSEGLIINPAFMVYFAEIKVTYPAGSTLTCTSKKDSSISFTAEVTTSPYTFVVPHADTWTIKGVSGSKNKSVTVNATTFGTVYTATIVYDLILYQNGSLASGYSRAGSMSTALSSSPAYPALMVAAGYASEWDVGGTAVGWITPTIDCSQFTKLHIIGGQTNVPNAGHNVGLSTNTTDWTNFTVKNSSLANTEKKADFTQKDINISSYNGKYYFKIGAYSTHVFISKIWFD